MTKFRKAMIIHYVLSSLVFCSIAAACGYGLAVFLGLDQKESFWFAVFYCSVLASIPLRIVAMVTRYPARMREWLSKKYGDHDEV